MTNILGYLTQCDCGQHAFTDTPVEDWRCPSCLSLNSEQAVQR